MTFRRFRIYLRGDGRGPYQIATDDVQESQRRLKRRFRIVLENFPEFYMRASAWMRIVSACSIFINARYRHLSCARWHAWTRLDVDSLDR